MQVTFNSFWKNL